MRKAGSNGLPLEIRLPMQGLFLHACLALAFLFALPDGAWAQTVRLEDVTAAALGNSGQMRLEDEKVRRAEGQLQRAQGAFDWMATAEGGWERLYVAEVRNGFLSNDLQEVDAWRTTLGIGRLFRNGITVQPGVSFYANTDVSAAQTLGLTKTRPALNLTIPLFRGLGEDNLAASTERAALAGVEASRLGRDYMAQRAMHDAAMLFWNCLALSRHVRIAETDRQIGDEFVATLRALVESGQGEPVTLDRALANQAVQDVTLARSRTADQLCRRDLALITDNGALAEPPSPAGEFPPMEGMEAAIAALDERSLAEAALSRREDVQALMRQASAQGELLRGARDNSQPRVELYVDPSRVLVRLSQSLGRGTQDGQLAEALAGEGETRIQLQQLEAHVRRDISAQLRGLKDAWVSWQALSRSAALMEGVGADARRRYETGVMTQQEYRNVQGELALVQGQLIDASLQYALSLGGLRLATGTIETEVGVQSAASAAVFRTLPEQ